MKTKDFGLVTAAFALSVSFAAPAFAIIVEEPPPPPPVEEKVKGNNGLGNGDQTAPGNSLTKNKAENQLGAPGHPSDKAQVPN